MAALFLFLGEKVISAVLTGSMIASGIIALSPSRRQESRCAAGDGCAITLASDF